MELDLVECIRFRGKDVFHVRFQQYHYEGICEHFVTSSLPEPLIHILSPKVRKILKSQNTFSKSRAKHIIQIIKNRALESDLASEFFYPDYILNQGILDATSANLMMKHMGDEELLNGRYFSQISFAHTLASLSNTIKMAFYFYPTLYSEHMKKIDRGEFETSLLFTTIQSEYVNNYSPFNQFLLYHNENLKIFIQCDYLLSPLLMVVSGNQALS